VYYTSEKNRENQSDCLHVCTILLKKTEKTKGHSRMDNPETLATLGTKDAAGQRQTKQQHTTQPGKLI
jgi:hypothetical protein